MQANYTWCDRPLTFQEVAMGLNVSDEQLEEIVIEARVRPAFYTVRPAGIRFYGPKQIHELVNIICPEWNAMCRNGSKAKRARKRGGSAPAAATVPA